MGFMSGVVGNKSTTFSLPAHIVVPSNLPAGSSGFSVESTVAQTNSPLVMLTAKSGSTTEAASILNNGVGKALNIQQVGVSAAAQPALYVGTSSAQFIPIVQIQSDNASSTTSAALFINNYSYYPELFVRNFNTSASKDNFGSLYIFTASAGKPAMSFDGHTIYTGRTATDAYLKVTAGAGQPVRYLRLYS